MVFPGLQSCLSISLPLLFECFKSFNSRFFNLYLSKFWLVDVPVLIHRYFSFTLKVRVWFVVATILVGFIFKSSGSECKGFLPQFSLKAHIGFQSFFISSQHVEKALGTSVSLLLLLFFNELPQTNSFIYWNERDTHVRSVDVSSFNEPSKKMISSYCFFFFWSLLLLLLINRFQSSQTTWLHRLRSRWLLSFPPFDWLNFVLIEMLLS